MTDLYLKKYKTFLSSEKRFSGHTVKAYVKDLQDLFMYMSEEYELSCLLEVKAEFLRSWLVHLHESGLSPKSIRRKISSVNSFYLYLRKQGYTHLNPARGLMLPKVQKMLPEFISQEQMLNLLGDERFSDDFPGRRDQLVLLMLYSTGLRRAELINLRLSNINFIKRVINVWGKGGKERLIPIGDRAISILRRYLTIREDTHAETTDYLILTDKGRKCYPKFIYNIVHNYLAEVPGLNKRSPHILRHTFATHLADSGADLNAVKTLLGHSNLTATEIYTHNTVESLKKIYETAFPKSGK